MGNKKLNKICEWIGYGIGIILMLWIFKVIIPYVIGAAVVLFVWKVMTGGKKNRGTNRKKTGPTWVERSINPNYMREESDAEAERQRRIRDRRQDERQRQWDEDWAKKRAAERLWDEQHH